MICFVRDGRRWTRPDCGHGNFSQLAPPRMSPVNVGFDGNKVVIQIIYRKYYWPGIRAFCTDFKKKLDLSRGQVKNFWLWKKIEARSSIQTNMNIA